jgi:hypothetical protein
MTSNLKQVSKEQFFSVIIGENLNVHPRIVSDWPYRHEWRLLDNSRSLVGVTQDYVPEGTKVMDALYYLVAEGS